MLYQPPPFREEDVPTIQRLIRDARLAVLASNGANGTPDITHLPLLLDPSLPPYGRLIGHVARGNAHAARLRVTDRALAIFTGVEAYISPNWYTSKAEHGRVVPTWNYEAVHATGPIEIIDDPARLRGIVAGLTDHHERHQPRPWTVDDAPPAFIAGQLNGIVGIILTIETLSAKRKLSQNRVEADRQGAAAGLAANPDPRDQATAAAMEQANAGRSGR
jgi:transcriptional regulator